MRRMAQSFLVVVLSGLVLFGSGQFTIGKMICQSGQTSYSMGTAKDCCEKNTTSHETVKGACCDLVNIYYFLNDYCPSSKLTPVNDQVLSIVPTIEVKLQSLNFRLVSLSSDLPPPDDLKDRLYSFRSLLL